MMVQAVLPKSNIACGLAPVGAETAYFLDALFGVGYGSVTGVLNECAYQTLPPTDPF